MVSSFFCAFGEACLAGEPRSRPKLIVGKVPCRNCASRTPGHCMGQEPQTQLIDWARGRTKMMNHNPMMDGGGMAMMIGMGLVWLLTIIALVLAIAALIKYLRSGAR